MPAIQSSSRHRSRRALADINVVPYIDVMLVLLIIFMVTAPLITPSMVKLPTVGNAPQEPTTRLEVTIRKDGTMLIALRDPKVKPAQGDGESTTLKTLPEMVRQLSTQAGTDMDAMPVLIAADKSVKYDAVMKALDVLKRNGVQRVGLAVKTTP